ncbi:MAG TPA: sulfotransferase domain-containing protein [Virgibacillus sp.]|nr:sulfotransferase domain-containing protein [Virgibacillus sp.]
MGKLPDFLIIGEMKCGTTALYKYITEHPQIEPAKRKELAFFNIHFNKGIRWYQHQFPENTQLTGEASGYLKFPDVAKKVADVIPDVKLIVILRNPVDRVYSHYHMHLKKRKIAIPFEKAIQQHPGYLHQGKYVLKLKKWMEIFPAEQFLILESEQLDKMPQKMMNRVFRYLGVHAYSVNVHKKYNTHNYAKIHPHTRKKLLDYYEPYNKDLYQLLNKRFDWGR